ncbi:helix-turn-helix domain-containing protein [Schaalia hyovaginalis]|uniref:helix-turn-helix domain-containing protein n=1 Tax=Schaalia hyovaginalis TaxID=29316 RepID=UPI0026EBBAB8|nr:helix-turn-helix transcriptional regulator [Schaalia hyovaginalis]MCI6557340.1 helix-turn-helix domain-containing protein [Schaalia hyovaginalis]MDY3094215.1 helix-turn-helix transcriptional regulator [Schaalia hyovaginalis]MDY3664728.1 helix-turn-helix transcriptional regulator [Schaalia hyovaginalis]
MARLTTQEIVSAEVRRYMRSNGSTQADLAATLGVTQAAVSKKVLGLRRWSIEDVDKLEAAGYPIAVRPLYLGEDFGR